MRRRQFLLSSGHAALLGAGLLATRSALGSDGSATTDRPATDAPYPDAEAVGSGFLGSPSPDVRRGAPGVRLDFLVRPADTGGAFALIEGRGRKGMEPGRHVHQHEDEVVRLHEGRMRFEVGGEHFEAGPGDVVFLPRRVPHSFRLLSETIHVDLILTPGRFADYFWTVSAPLEGEEIPAPATAPPPPEVIERMVNLLGEYGISPA